MKKRFGTSPTYVMNAAGSRGYCKVSNTPPIYRATKTNPSSNACNRANSGRA